MTSLSHLRPREKILERSVSSLTNHELLQAIIGSGSSTRSVQRIARDVLRLFKKQATPTVRGLCEIPGLGVAKASLLVAAFEFAQRTNIRDEDIALRMEQLLVATQASSGVLVCVSLDGHRRIIQSHTITLMSGFDEPLVQLVARKLVIDQARYASFGIEGNEDQFNTHSEVCRSLYRALCTLGVQLLEFKIKTPEGMEDIL